MKHREIPNRDISDLLFWAMMYSFIYSGLTILLPCIVVGVLSGWYLPLQWVILIIGLFLALLIGITKAYKQAKWNQYGDAIRRAYQKSIKAALETNYPEGIIYILNNTLAQLQAVRINYQTVEYNGYLITEYPNQSKLRDAVKMAEEVRQQWGDITRLGGVAAQIQAMENIKYLIRTEDIFMGRLINIRKNEVRELYWFSYTKSDHRAVSELNNNPPIVEPKPPVNNPPSPPPQRVLTFEEYLQQHPGLLYLKPPEQREEYHKYLASMGVQPPSSKSRSYYPDNSNYGTGNKGDDSVW